MFRFTAVLAAAVVLFVGLPVHAAGEPGCQHVAPAAEGSMSLCLDADLDTTWMEDTRWTHSSQAV